MPVPTVQQRRFVFTGRVQGVGFRYTTEQLAQGLPVTGYVRNRDDGRVEMIAEGEPAEIDRLIAAIRLRFGEAIGSIADEKSPATGGYQDFTIKR